MIQVNKLKGGFRNTPPSQRTKLTIQNFNKGVGEGIFWEWDLVEARDDGNVYNFRLRKRGSTDNDVLVQLGRIPQWVEDSVVEPMYQLLVSDGEGEWDEGSWFFLKDLFYKNFWNTIEEVIGRNEYPHPNLKTIL